MSSVATAKPEELEALAKAEASAIASSVKGARAAHRKGWLGPSARIIHRMDIGPEAFDLTDQGRAILSDARALGWKPVQTALI